MEQRTSLITLGVADVVRARGFYERLGWQSHEVEEAVCLPAGDSALTLWSREKLAAGFSGVVLAHNVRSEAEVDEVIATAADAGATITRPPATTFYGGYAGCFTDLDGHAWEIAYNPGFPLAADGSLTIPDFGTP